MTHIASNAEQAGARSGGVSAGKFTESDITAARAFITALTGSPDTPVVFQTFDDNRKRKDARPKGTHDPYARVISGRMAEHFDTLANLNKQGAGIFITVQECKPGKRSNDNITSIRAAINDFDGDNAVALAEAAASKLPPSIVVESSPGKRHLYWLTSPDTFELSEYTPFIESMVAITGADDNAKDLARVLRVPGFDHCKGERHRVTMLNDNAFLIYGKQDIADAFDIDLSVIGTKAKAKTKAKTDRAAKRHAYPSTGAYYDPLDYAINERDAKLLHSALRHVGEGGKRTFNPADRATWINVCAALSRSGDIGFAIFHEWSAEAGADGGYVDEEDCQAKFDELAVDAKSRYPDIFAKAQVAGWAQREADELPEALAQAPEEKVEPFPVDYPPGLVGEVARYIFDASIMPVQSFSIAGGLSAISHILANRHEIGDMGTPLNLYHVLIGKTGHGKEDPRTAIKSLLSAANAIEGVMEEVSSDTALLRALSAFPIRLMMTDEMGIYLKLALAKNGDQHKQGVIKQMLSLFGLARSTITPKPYADPSKNIPTITGAYLNVLGTTTPEQFVGALTNLAIDDGTMNRLLCVTAAGVGSKNRRPARAVPAELKTKLTFFADIMQPNGNELAIKIMAAAEEIFVRFYEDYQLPNGALWARAEEQARRVAGVIACGDGGTVKLAHAQWAVAYVTWCLRNVTREIQHGMAETIFGQRALKVLKFIREVRTYSGDLAYSNFTKRGLMPRGKLLKLARLSTRELEEVIEHLVATGEIKSATEGQTTLFFVGHGGK